MKKQNWSFPKFKVRIGESVGDALRRIEKPPPVRWQDKSAEVWSFYCPLCRIIRKVPYQPNVTRMRHIFQAAISAIIFTMIFWTWFGWKGLSFFVFIWSVFELIYRAQTRALLECPHCGFDPYWYKVDVKKARIRVEEFWKSKFQKAGIPFPQSPPTNGLKK